MENAKILTEAQIEAIEKVAELVRKVMDVLWEAAKKAVEQIKKVWRAVMDSYHNKRVVHLALHHKDLKVRRKNIAKILRWFRRYIRCKE